MSALLKSVNSNSGDWTAILKEVKLFEGLKKNQEALSQFSESMHLKKFSKSHTLIKEGELGDEFFILIRGEVSVHKKTPEGDVFKVAIMTSDQHASFGEGGLVEAEPRSATVQCDTECECLVMNRSEFDVFAKKYPQWATPIYKSLFQGLMARLKKMNTDLMLLHKALTTEIRG